MVQGKHGKLRQGIGYVVLFVLALLMIGEVRTHIVSNTLIGLSQYIRAQSSGYGEQYYMGPSPCPRGYVQTNYYGQCELPQWSTSQLEQYCPGVLSNSYNNITHDGIPLSAYKEQCAAYKARQQILAETGMCALQPKQDITEYDSGITVQDAGGDLTITTSSYVPLSAGTYASFEIHFSGKDKQNWNEEGCTASACGAYTFNATIDSADLKNLVSTSGENLNQNIKTDAKSNVTVITLTRSSTSGAGLSFLAKVPNDRTFGIVVTYRNKCGNGVSGIKDFPVTIITSTPTPYPTATQTPHPTATPTANNNNNNTTNSTTTSTTTNTSTTNSSELSALLAELQRMQQQLAQTQTPTQNNSSNSNSPITGSSSWSSSWQYTGNSGSTTTSNNQYASLFTPTPTPIDYSRFFSSTSNFASPTPTTAYGQLPLSGSGSGEWYSGTSSRTVVPLYSNGTGTTQAQLTVGSPSPTALPTIANAKFTREQVTVMFTKVYKRAPTASELEYWYQRLAKKWTKTGSYLTLWWHRLLRIKH